MPVRTKPLIVDKATGEPKHPFPIHLKENSLPWLVVITTEVGRRGKRFHSLREAKTFAKQVEKEHGGEVSVTVVSRSVGYGPPHSLVSDEVLHEQNARGRYWCPYCRQFRVFAHSRVWGIDRCEVCGTFIDDFHVTKNNPRLWGH